MHIRFGCPGSQLALLEPCEAMFNELPTVGTANKPQVRDPMLLIDEPREGVCDTGVVMGRGVLMRVRRFQPLRGTR